MKKIIVIVLILIFLISLNTSEEIIIPEDSIRFRIIANSNDIEDQELKLEIRNELNNTLFTKLNKATTKEEAKQIITENKPIIENVLKKYNIDYQINYGYNYFPEKEYKGITYSSGNYESLVISLGEAAGNNWWCVMYPPLCLIDSEENMGEKEYKLYIKELIEKIAN